MGKSVYKIVVIGEGSVPFYRQPESGRHPSRFGTHRTLSTPTRPPQLMLAASRESICSQTTFR